MAIRPVVAWAACFLATVDVVAASARPMCMMADALAGSVDAHIDDWDRQVDFALNETFNCSIFLEWVYVSRDRIKTEIEFIRGNFTRDDDLIKTRGDEGISTTMAMSHMSKAASLVSAHMHIHGMLAVARRECLSEHLQLLFLMSLKRMNTLLHQQLRHLWVVFQGTSELLRQGASKWLAELVELFEADLHTMESIMVSWMPAHQELVDEACVAEKGGDPESQACAKAQAMPRPLSDRPGPPLPNHNPREPDSVALSTIEVLRMDTFDEWDNRKPLVRALLRYVLPRDGHVADFCSGGGFSAKFLNDTGLVTAYAFDPSPNIRLLSKGSVEHAPLNGDQLQLWMAFDVALCLTAAGDFRNDEDTWSKAWKNLDAHVTRGVILACGQGEVRERAMAAAAAHAPTLSYDAGLSAQLQKAESEGDGICVFWRAGQAPSTSA
eukprot:TRINITY_DN34231_c0_g1_i1.p1 TRINITY_DN34231_c0_g1~~TRINITY_DN34231_c0_g1_i1.p1  ORF type:complete len:438 (-),score=63.30 TRINITY_DN34231_c0_g1_i1:165-1478(-)